MSLFYVNFFMPLSCLLFILPSIVFYKTNGTHFSPRWSLVCQLRWRRCRQSIWVLFWTPHQAVSSSTSPNPWPRWRTSKRTGWAWQQRVWVSALPYETPTIETGYPAPSAYLSGDTLCKWIIISLRWSYGKTCRFLHCYWEGYFIWLWVSFIH